MPIKFRCNHCRQLLGISRGKAGQPVDCPTCGLTVRVPHLDGRVDPLPTPGLNLQDSALAGALDQLAMIGQLPPDEIEFAADPDPQPSLPGRPTPVPQPVAIEPPLPAEPAVRHEPPPSKPADIGGAELASLVRADAQLVAGDSRPRSAHRDLTWLAGGVVMAGLCFAGGYLVGRQSVVSTAANPPSAAPPVESAVAPPKLAAPAIRGRITYRTENGDSRPDSGARLIVLPEKKAGEFRLPVTGFRAGDSPADVQAAQAALRALGGDVATVADDGTFEVTLAAAGRYNVLVLSRYAGRMTAEPPEASVRALLEAWFMRPDQLLGQVRHHLGQCRYSGEAVQLWDHSFERET